MGIYHVNCPQCKRDFAWFSGNLPDQRCEDCKNGINPDLRKALDNEDYEKINQSLSKSHTGPDNEYTVAHVNEAWIEGFKEGVRLGKLGLT